MKAKIYSRERMLNKMDEESRFPIPGVGFKIKWYLCLTIIFRKEKEA